MSVVGDARDEIVAGLRELAGHDLVITSGGLGPTHDDRTVEAVAEAAGAELALDEQLLATIAEITAGYARRRGTDPALNRDGDRKQALVPRGATVIPPAGTAPGLLLPLGAGQSSSCCPARRASSRRSGARALELEPIAALRARAGTLLRSTLRVYGVGEPAVARAFAAAGGDAGGTRTTICARAARGRGHRPRGARARSRARGARRRACASSSARPCTPRTSGRWPSTCSPRCASAASTSPWPSPAPQASSARALASIPGSSDVLLGGVIAYANEVKQQLLGVPAELLAEYGAVSAECARAMAAGARAATGAEVAVSVTGVAGPGGRHGAQAGRARLPARLGARGGARAGAEPARRPRAGARIGGGRGAPARAHDGFVTPRAVAAYPAR